MSGEPEPPVRAGSWRTHAAVLKPFLPMAEVVLALVPFVWLITNAGLRSLLATCLRAIVGGVGSMVALIAIDRPTLATGALAVVRSVLLLAPMLRMLLISPRRRLAWAPLAFMVWVPVLGISVPGISGPLMWVLLCATSAAAWVAVTRPALRMAALLPWIVALEPLIGHGPLNDTVWTPARLAGRCAANDGVRPIDFRPEIAGARYYAVTPASPDLMLLTGENRSFWVRRAADGARLGPAVTSLHGNMWQGCAKGGKLWLTARGRVCEATPPAQPGAAGSDTCHQVPGPPEVGAELDYVDVLCPKDWDSVFVTQLLRGGFIELDLDTQVSTWHRVVPGMNLQGVMRGDGRIVGITTSELVVFDPATDGVVEQQAAGLVAMGIDICPADDAVVVADFAGRVRMFERAAGGEYRFRAGADVLAPRRVAFSPSCESFIVTSGDDRHAFLMRRRDLQILRTWKLGPGLRDVVYLDDHTVAVADACTVSYLDIDG